MSAALVRPASSIVWEIRAAWGSGRRVALSLDERCQPGRLEGPVRRVAASGAFVVVAGRQVPVEAILAVHHPSRLGDSTVRAGQWSGPGYAPPQEESLW